MKIERFNEDKWIYPFIMRAPKLMREGMPIIIQLHGAGERGNGKDELSLVEVNGFSHILVEEEEYDCILIQPQCPKDSFWVADIPSIILFINQVVDEFKADTQRVYLVGIRMGGFGTWYTAMAKPEMFAAIAPCCGGGMPWNAAVLTMPIWAFHGANDEVVNVRESVEMIESVKKFNSDVKLSVYKGLGHNSWTKAFSKELLSWLLSKSK